MITILYVDDEPDFVDLCRIYLKNQEDFYIDACDFAYDALQKIASTPYDIIISDYQMPGMNGIEFLKHIRSDYGDIPFILFTGRGREDVVIDALNNGADFYLQKGSDTTPLFAELVHMIYRAVDRKQAKTALQTSISQLYHAEEITGLGYWSFDLNTGIVSGSDGAKKIYGLGDHEWTIAEVQTIPLPEYRRLLDESLKDLISGERPYNVEFQIKRPDDNKIIDIHSIAEYDPVRNRVFGTIQDITRMKEVERELRKKNEELTAIHAKITESEEELITHIDMLTRQSVKIRDREEQIRLLSDNLPNGLVYQLLIKPDGSRSFQYISAGVEQIHQVSAQKVLEDHTVLYNQIIPDDLPGLMHAEQEAFKTKSSFSYEIRVRTPDDQIHWILLRSIPHVLHDGSILWDGIEIDISDQKRAEEELRKIHELFHQFMLHSPIYIYVKEVTPDTSRVLYASENFQEMIGIPGSRMVGHTMDELFPPNFAEKIAADDWNVVSNGNVLKIRENLNEKHYITIKFPIIEKNRTLLAGYTIDITELHKTQEALHEANQKIRLLTGLTRHDIFNELSVIMGYQDLMADTEDLEEIRDYLSRAKKTCEQIIATTSFTREYEDFGTTESRWQNVRRIIESAKNEVNTDGITIINDIPENCEIYADPVIRKVFTTLLENAIRHGETITTIQCSCRTEENQLIIACQDDGIGVPYDEKSCIFGHKYGKHTGIGLFLAKEILSITGLSIRECGEPGKGARFEIIVPEKEYRFLSDSKKKITDENG